MELHAHFVNWLNHITNEKINNLHKLTTSKSASVGCQGIKIRTETIIEARNHSKTEACNLSLVFHITLNVRN